MLQSFADCPMIYPSSVRHSSSRPSFDLMLSRDNCIDVPVIFINKALPDILGCIARELQSYLSELSLMHMVSGRIQSPGDGPLACWYRSIFENIYLDVSLEKCIVDTDVIIRDGFSLPVVDTLLIPHSCFQYMTLVLPPLWKTDGKAVQNVPHTMYPLHLPFCNIHRKSLCHFRYASDTDIWYAYLDTPGHKKRIFRKTCISGRFL